MDRDIVLGSIWFVIAIVFAFLAFDAYESKDAKLNRLSGETTDGTMAFSDSDGMPLNSAHKMNVVVAVNNRNIGQMEASIRRRAQLSFVLNSVSCVAALIGFLHRQVTICTDIASRPGGSPIQPITNAALG